MKQLLHIALTLVIIMILHGCKDDSTTMVSHSTDPEAVPTMTTTDVQTIISDSGHTRYRITAPLWNMFEEAKKPHWTFPKGVICEELNDKFDPISTIKCDSAYFDKIKNLWTLTGNVSITTTTGDLVNTDELMWDQQAHRLYSDAFIHIEKQGRIIEGYGYESNERLTTYQLRQVEAIFPIDERRMPHPNSGNTPRPMQQPSKPSSPTNN